jgi:hypothetical protein
MDLSSADPGVSPGSPISASRGAPDAAPGAHLRSHAQDAAGFDPDLARADGPLPAAPDGPERVMADGLEPPTADDRNRAGRSEPRCASPDDPHLAPPDGPEPLTADDRNRAG